MKDKKNKADEGAELSSEFDSLGGYTGNNLADGYEPEQDADDI